MLGLGQLYFTYRLGPTSYAAAALSLAAALIHAWAAPGHFEHWWGYGTFFLVTAVAQGAYGLALLRRRLRPSLFLPGGVGNLAIIILYTVIHIAGISLFGPEAGEVEGLGSLDLCATILGMALVATLLTLSRGRGLSREGWSMLVLVLAFTLLLVGSLTMPGHH